MLPYSPFRLSVGCCCDSHFSAGGVIGASDDLPSRLRMSEAFSLPGAVNYCVALQKQVVVVVCQRPCEVRAEVGCPTFVLYASLLDKQLLRSLKLTDAM